MRHAPVVPYDWMLVIAEVCALWFALWLVWAAQTPSVI